jgi:hypothetical protein
MAGLRLDTREGQTEQRKRGVPVVAGRPAESLLIERIFSEKKGLIMPPVSSHKTLSDEQKQLLRKWVEQGAEWQGHWAFEAPVRPRLPEVKQREWERNAIDRFILAKLEERGLTPAKQAGKRTLIRRVSLDLTGLPPKPEEVEAFVRDNSPEAYERLVDRLLQSPHAAEHRARYWLDAARYADTHGLHIDNYREMWAYRDWVIQAFQKNMPFDRFTVEQIAGDLLPDRGMDQMIATGFHRCNITTNEGGVIPEEVAAIYDKDRVDTTGAVWLGLTVGCASCHDHKFDPITQRDFYSLAAFFRNTTQNPLDGNVWDTPPVIVVPRQEDRASWERVEAERQQWQAQLASHREQVKPQFEAWLQGHGRASMERPLPKETEVFSLRAEPSELAGELISSRGKKASRVKLARGVGVREGPWPGSRAVHFGKEAGLRLPRLEYIDSEKPFTISAWIWSPEKGGHTVISQITEDKKKKQRRGWMLELNGPNPQLRLIGDENKSILLRHAVDHDLTKNAWHHIVFTYDGSRRRTGMKLWVDGKPWLAYGVGEDLIPLKGTIATKAKLTVGWDGNKKYYEDGAIADLRILNRVVSSEEVKLLGEWNKAWAAREKRPEELLASERDALMAVYLQQADARGQELAARLGEVEIERAKLEQRGSFTHVMQERPDSQAAAHLLHRGQYDQPRELLEAAAPSVLPSMRPEYPRNRLGLAQWLVDEANPLTSRVTVNRFWQEIFGTGLVATADDFGSQGEMPSHPELLDWLAVEFRDSGWDVRKLIRLVVTSATYRQSAVATEEKISKDADNRLLSRGPRFRMDAEMIRDYALAASGLLAPQIGGPSVKPYQPSEIWETVAMLGSNTRFYEQDSGANLYRRSLYTFLKRSAPPPSMEIFNATSREVCTVRRERTNTPLQALVTMNDPQFVEAARHLAQRAMQAHTDAEGQFGYMAERLLARGLEGAELEVVKRAYRDYLRHYDSHPADAKKLLVVGASRAPKLPPAEFAALTMVANQLMNLDEVLNK